MNSQEIVKAIGEKKTVQRFDKRLLKKAESAGNYSQAEEIRQQIESREQEINKLRNDLESKRRKLSSFAAYRVKAVAHNYSVR